MSSNRLEKLKRQVEAFETTIQNQLLDYAVDEKGQKRNPNITLRFIMSKISELPKDKVSKQSKPLLALAISNDFKGLINDLMNCISAHMSSNNLSKNSSTKFSRTGENKEKEIEIKNNINEKLKEIRLFFGTAKKKLADIEEQYPKINKSTKLPRIFEQAECELDQLYNHLNPHQYNNTKEAASNGGLATEVAGGVGLALIEMIGMFLTK